MISLLSVPTDRVSEKFCVKLCFRFFFPVKRVYRWNALYVVKIILFCPSPYRALQHCEELIQRYNRAEDSICLPDNKSVPHQNVTNHVGKAVEDCMRAIIGVLLNLTNDNGKTNFLHILY